jgi:hypothetical protein
VFILPSKLQVGAIPSSKYHYREVSCVIVFNHQYK